MSGPETVALGDLRVCCTLSGRGPPLLMLHGAEGDHHMFDALAASLNAYCTVIRYDQRDCGETENPSAPVTLRQLALDARALLLALGFPRANVYGTSFGGRVAQALAIAHPNTVESLALGSTWPLPAALEQLNPSGVAEILALRAALPESAEELATHFFPAAYLEEQPQLKELFKNARPWTERSKRRAEVVQDHSGFDARQITSRTLLLAGEVDRVVPPLVTLGMGDLIRGCQSVLLKGVGHAGAIQAASQVAHELVRFLGISEV